MPDPDADEQRAVRLPTMLVWGGVALAPIAVLVALIGSTDGSLRFAVLLLAVAIALVGSSVLIRDARTAQRFDLDDRLAQRIDTMREEMRDEIAAAARATHHRVQILQDDLVRFQSQRTPAAAPGQHPPAAAAQHAPGGTSGAVRASGSTPGAAPVARAAAVARVVPVPPVAASAAVPPVPHIPEPAPAYPQETPSRRADRHTRTDGGGRRSRWRWAADGEDDGYQVLPPPHPSPDRYESDRYGPDPQPADGWRAAPDAEPGTWRAPADHRDDYPHW